jgi:hypothetical protein
MIYRIYVKNFQIGTLLLFFAALRNSIEKEKEKTAGPWRPNWRPKNIYLLHCSPSPTFHSLPLSL